MANFNKIPVVLTALIVAGTAAAEVMDRPVGIRIGQRMTLKPYVSISATYDSNVDSRNDGDDDVVWRINPGLSLEYKAENWVLTANLHYQYNQYSKDHKTGSNTYNYHGYGEDVS